MDKIKTASALEAFQNPSAINQLLNITEGNSSAFPEDSIKDISEKLMVALADATSADNETFAKAFTAIQKKNAVANRDVHQYISYAEKTFEFLKDNWVYIHFTLFYLNKKGALDRIKHEKGFRTFFATLFDEDVPKDDTKK